MLKLLAHLVLFISLVGQFLLTPAMAMPNLLHAYSHTQMVANSSSMNMATPHADMKHGEQDCDMLMTHNSAAVTIDCDALCAMMSIGECVTQSAAITGLLFQPQFLLDSPGTNGRIQTLSWVALTADNAQLNPPPIRCS